jgi:predicted lipoprotein with Yx(FWY)xxD motif
MRLRSASVVALVGCVGIVGILRHPAVAQQQGDAPGAPARAEQPAPAEAAAGIATPPEITIQNTPAGPLFADRKGFTLYMTERDKEPGKSTCVGPCAEQWVPLRSESDAKAFGDWTLVSRADGRPQWAYKGRPLYRYRWEAKPRWAEAHNEVWRYATVVNFPPVGANRRGYTPGNSDAKVVLPPTPGGIQGGPTQYGMAFTDSRQMTLYSQAAVSPCVGACLESWAPLPAPQAASPVGDWTIVTRADGFRQWAFQGKPVYRSTKDVKPADANGASEAWKPVLVPVPGKPAAAAAKSAGR